MTASPPPPGPSSRRPLGFDDFVGILVAFLVLGSIFFWSFGRRTQGFNIFSAFAPAAQPAASPALDLFGRDDDEATPSPTPTVGATTPATVPIPGVLVPTATPTPQVGVVAPAGTIASPTVTPTANLPDAEPTFSDVPATYWAYPFIEALAKRDIVRGFADRTFRPDQPVNRAEFAALIESTFENAPQQRNPVDFNDVPQGFWAIPAINRAFSSGFMEGYPGNVFRPGQQIPRVQAIASLAKGLGLTPSGDVNAIVQRFQDADQIPNWATDKVAAATASRIVVNHPNLNALEPNRPTTRAEAAALLYQALAQRQAVEPIESQYIVNP
ncbi:S-layer homology domain-containing protein [Microcoleus sp. FACHB-1515]|uniref:S-layer homology domain-containing protein n=1 Tax=Cyanophyceae TaxID=3028117 RepID=UPI001689EE90|nr:S-layer homology domain-containing protein [Microcoleus sp. FACHB-1515]MBD2090422.1 S-layer homology domain-containing protein [Microcoleus sp. FACHB-1515]